MYIDFSQTPAFLGVIVLAVLASIVGNFVGLAGATIYRHARGESYSGEDGLKLFALMVVSFSSMLPIKAVIALVVTAIASYSYGSVSASTGAVALITATIGFLFTFLVGRKA